MMIKKIKITLEKIYLYILSFLSNENDEKKENNKKKKNRKITQKNI